MWQVFLLFLLVTPVQLYVGSVFYVKCYSALSNGHATMDVLISLGTSAAYIYSLLSMGLAVLSHEYAGHTFFETCAMLITFVLFGRILEHAARERTHDAVSGLVAMQATTAVLAPEDENSTFTQELDVRLIREGDPVKVSGALPAGVQQWCCSGVNGREVACRWSRDARRRSCRRIHDHRRGKPSR